MNAAQSTSALLGCAERASVEAKRGPKTLVALMTAVSIAYAVLRELSGTALFQRGRTERLIGGETRPINRESGKIHDLLEVYSKTSKPAAYEGTNIRMGHFCPHRSRTEPRAPAVIEFAKVLKPRATPA